MLMVICVKMHLIMITFIVRAMRLITLKLCVFLIVFVGLVGCTVEDGVPLVITRLYEDQGKIHIEWLARYESEFFLRRYVLDGVNRRWEEEYRIPVSGRYWVDGENLRAGEIYGFVIEGSGNSESDMKSIRFVGLSRIDD